MDMTWFAFIHGDILGPLTPSQLHLLVERGLIDAYTPVKNDRMERYVPAFEVVGLLPYVDPGPPLRPEPGWRLTMGHGHGHRHVLLLVVAILGWVCALLVMLTRPA